MDLYFDPQVLAGLSGLSCVDMYPEGWCRFCGSGAIIGTGQSSAAARLSVPLVILMYLRVLTKDSGSRLGRGPQGSRTVRIECSPGTGSRLNEESEGSRRFNASKCSPKCSIRLGEERSRSFPAVSRRECSPGNLAVDSWEVKSQNNPASSAHQRLCSDSGSRLGDERSRSFGQLS